MHQFRVPPSLSPGVYREGVGFFAVGDVLSLPDRVSAEAEAKGKLDVPNAKLVPLTPEGQAWLQDLLDKGYALKLKQEEEQKKAAVAAPQAPQAPAVERAPALPPPPPPDERMTVKEAAKALRGAVGKH